MQLKEHYTNMWDCALQRFESNAFEYDSLIDSVKDYRFGVTLVARPSGEVSAAGSNENAGRAKRN